MNKIKFIFILILLLLILNIIISNNSVLYKTGKIEKIEYSKNKITIKLKNDTNKYILFTNKIINLKKHEKITIIGKESEYRNEKQIIVNTIKG